MTKIGWQTELSGISQTLLSAAAKDIDENHYHQKEVAKVLEPITVAELKGIINELDNERQRLDNIQNVLTHLYEAIRKEVKL